MSKPTPFSRTNTTTSRDPEPLDPTSIRGAGFFELY
jgi:hypothetical protein